MFNIKLDNSKDIIEFLKLPVIVGLKVTITYDFGFRKATGVILRNEKYFITIQLSYDTLTIVKDAILTLELKKSDYTFVNKFVVKNDEEFKLGDLVEIVNIEGLNRVLYSNYPKGFSKNLIGLQGKITMIDKVTDNNIIYYLVDFPAESRAIFLEENLKLINKGDDKMLKKESAYLCEDIGIRKDYLYKITIDEVGTITGEIINFNGCTYVIKSYKDGELNHYIVKYKNILDLHPFMTIEKYNKKMLKL